MNQIVQVISAPFNTPGVIPEGVYPYFLDEKGDPSLEVRYTGRFFKSTKKVFCFPAQVGLIGPLDEQTTKSNLRSSSFFNNATRAVAGGIFVSLMAGALGLAKAQAANCRGFFAIYLNDEKKTNFLWAAAAGNIIDEIFASVPSHKHTAWNSWLPAN